MEKSSIKEVTTREIELAIAEALQKLTNKEWNVGINDLRFPLQDGGVAALYGTSEQIEITLSANEVRKQVDTSNLPF
jgi:hypothetical protein